MSDPIIIMRTATIVCDLMTLIVGADPIKDCSLPAIIDAIHSIIGGNDEEWSWDT